jgi:hypothetical protein
VSGDDGRPGANQNISKLQLPARDSSVTICGAHNNNTNVFTESIMKFLQKLFSKISHSADVETNLQHVTAEHLQVPTCSAPSASAALRTDGVYQSERTDDYWQYLRFYEDETVLTVSSTGTPEQIARWFKKENIQKNGLSHGKVQVHGSQVSFASTSQEGTVDYEGTIQGTTLTVKSHSHINGRRATRKFRFVAFSQSGS